MQRRFKELLMLCAVCLVLGYTNHGQQEVKFHEVKFRQVVRLSVGSKEGQVFVKVHPNGLAVVPRLLPPDKDGNFWIVGEAQGGIMRVNRSGQVVTILRWQSVQPPVRVHKDGTYEVAIYSLISQKLVVLLVNGCRQCKHPYLGTIIGLDDKERVWVQFLSSNLSLDEDPTLTACAVAFDLQGKIVRHIEGTWGLSGGRLWRRTKSIGGSYIVLDPETMKTTEIPVPTGWDGFFVGVDINRELIWWRCWRLDNVKDVKLMAFGKEGIVTLLPMPYRFLGAESGKKILSSEAVIGADGRLYIAQCTEDAFYIFEADMSFLKR